MTNISFQHKSEIAEAAVSQLSRRGWLALAGAFCALGIENSMANEGDRQMDIEIFRSGSRASTKGASDWFTGAVRIDPLFSPFELGRTSGAHVTFEPGARTAWHTHPLGQTLIVTSGLGWVQREGGRVEEVRPGDVVWFPPNMKHWHGATANTAMSHIAIQEAAGGKAVDWLEQVSDAQYRK